MEAFLPLILIFAIFWLLWIRPQSKRALAHATLIERLEPGQEVVTSAGIYGTIRRVEDDRVVLEVAPGTELRLDKRAVAGVVSTENPPS